MRFLSCMTVLICVVLSLSEASMAEPPEQPSQITSREGPWALLFQVKSNFSLAPFEASTVSVQRDVLGSAALRLGVGVYATSTDGPESGETSDEREVSVSGTYLRYASRERELSLFFGGGPEVGFTRLSRLDLGSLTGDTLVTYYEWELEQNSWHVGLGAILGAEWRLTPHIAVTGQYNTSATYTSTQTDRSTRKRVAGGAWETDYDTHEDRTGWSFGDMQVKLGLAVYF